MAKYRAKQITEIEAEQFLPPNQIPKGVLYVYHSSISNTYSGQVRTIQGLLVNVKAGEWIVQEPDNPERFYPIADESFKRKYEKTMEFTTERPTESGYYYVIWEEGDKPIPVYIKYHPKADFNENKGGVDEYDDPENIEADSEFPKKIRFSQRVN